MGLRVFPVIGEALHFGARRLGVTARVAWLAVVLLFLVELVSIYGYLSVIAGKPMTFAEIPNFQTAARYLAQYGAQGWENAPGQMAAIRVASTVLQIILISSFMAPLIRYSGLGERPRPGLVRLPFGPDQLRFIGAGLGAAIIVAVIAVLPAERAGVYVTGYVAQAMQETFASFPDPASLHTYDVLPAAQALEERGELWLYTLAIPLAAVIPFAFLAWGLGVQHFRIANRPNAGGRGNLIARALIVLAVLGALGAVVYWFFGQAEDSNSFMRTMALLGLFAGVVAVYLNLRLAPWQAIAVCRGSMGFANTLAITRGWNLFRLIAIFVLFGAVMMVVLLLINMIAAPMIISTLALLQEATAVSTRLVASGAEAEWVAPTFVWIRSITLVLLNFLWTFFLYGVVAGLYGRLYRESANTVYEDAQQTD